MLEVSRNKYTRKPLVWLRNLCSKGQPKKGDESILTLQEQIKAWRKANREMGWNITPERIIG